MTLFALPFQISHSNHYADLGVSPEATAQELRAAAARQDSRLKEEGADEDAVVAAHAVRLENAEARAEHDRDYPPLALMRLEPTWEPFLDDRATGLAVLRREIEAFLADRGADVFHPTDTTRHDFSADFTRVSLLDVHPND